MLRPTNKKDAERGSMMFIGVSANERPYLTQWHKLTKRMIHYPIWISLVFIEITYRCLLFHNHVMP